MAEAAPRLAQLFHVGAFCIYAYTIYYSFAHVHVPPPYPKFAYAGKAKFLTQWNLCLCGLYFALCVVLNVLPLRLLYRLRDYIFCSVSLPSCIFVTSLFWGLYAIDRSLIFPKEIEPFYPNWVNHCSHTLITVTAVCEALLYPHRVPSKLGGFSGILAWFSVYQIWVLYLGVVHEVWVYPVMRVLSPAGLTVFFIGCCIAVFVLHLGCNYLLRFRSQAAHQTKQAKLG